MKQTAILVFVFVVVLLTGCSRAQSHTTSRAGDERVVRLIMSDSAFNSEVVPILKAEVAKQGFTLEWVVVNDIIQPNKLVDDGSADANSFQHEPYFDQFVTDHGLKNVTRGFYTLFTPSGLFSRKHKSLADLPDGATIGIPVDPSNNGRALFMLRDRGLLELRPGVDVTHASLRDITANPRRFKLIEVDQLMLLRTLDDVDVGFLFLGIAIKAGIDPRKEALALEDETNPAYKGIVAIRKDLVGAPKIQALQNAYASDALKAYFRKLYGDTITFLDGFNQPTNLAAQETSS